MRKFLLFATALFTLAACATPSADTAAAGAASTRDCFRNEDIDGFSVVDDHTVHVSISPNRSYALTTMERVHDMDFALQAGFRTRGAGNWICVGRLNDVEIIGGRNGMGAVHVTEVTRVPEAAPAAAETTGS